MEQSDLPEIVYLDPKKIRLRGGDREAVHLTLPGDRTYLEIRARLAFPLSHPGEFISLHDRKDELIGLLRSASALDRDSRRILAQELDRRYFSPRILSIARIREEYGCTLFDVETTRGPTKFGVRHVRENVREIEPGHVRIRDLHGTIYEIPDVKELDAASQARLSQII